MFSRNKIFSKKKFSFIVIFLGLIFFLSFNRFLRPVENFFWNIALPFQKFFYISGQKIEKEVSFLKSISQLKIENEKLLKENQALSVQNSFLLDQKKENDLLRQQLDLAPRKEYHLEAGFVIGKDPRGLENWIMIDKGEKNGIEKGMPVIVSDGILIGTVKDVYKNSSSVLLLSDAGSLINVKNIQTKAKGILKGEYNLGIIMDLVDHAEVLNVGDEVVTSGLGESIPRGLLVGKIQEVYETSDRLFWQAVIIPQIKYSQLEVVFVIKNK